MGKNWLDELLEIHDRGHLWPRPCARCGLPVGTCACPPEGAIVDDLIAADEDTPDGEPDPFYGDPEDGW